MEKTKKHLLFSSCLFIGAVSIAHLLDLWHFVIPADYIQLLDANELRNHPLDSLMYLHSQPPLLNALLALVFNLSDALHIADATIAKFLFLAGGFIGSILFFFLLYRLTRSAVLAGAGLIILLANPAFHYFGGLFFYPFILLSMFLMLFWLIAKYLDGNRPLYLYLIVLLAAVITNTRALFHPVWAVGLFALVVAGRRWTSTGTGSKTWLRSALCLVLLLSLLTVWPLKNYLLFGQFTYSSLSGFNLAHHLPVGADPIVKESLQGKSERVEQFLADFRPVSDDDSLRVLTDIVDSDEQLNWNHVSFLLANPELKKKAIQWRLENPDIYARTALVHYLIWCNPSSVHPYDQVILGPPNPVYQGYARIHNAVLTADIRGPFERLTPNLLFHEAAQVRSRPVRYTVYGLIFFPLLLIATGTFVALNMRKRRPLEVIILACMFCHLFAMAVVCLTDGQEGNRMSLSTIPVVIIMAGYTITEAAGALRARMGNSDEQETQ